MDQKIVFGSIGSIVKYLGILMIVPLGVAIWYGGRPIHISLFIIKTWLIPLAITTIFGVILERKIGVRTGVIKRREGFAIVALGWLAVAYFGSLPYIFSATLSPIDAFFESMSGFTTTGSTVMLNMGDVDRSILLWRSFTQWIGGMGVILLFIAVLPTFGIAGSQLFDREFPGPMAERIRPRVQVTARMLWSIYVVLTVAEVVALFYAAKMPLYDSLCTAFCTMPTGGFSPHPENIAGYLNPIAELIIVVFMFLAGMNFVLQYSLLRNPRKIIANKEFQVYCFLLFMAISIITADLYIHKFASIQEAFRYGGFQAVSIMTTTGFTTADFNVWSPLSQIILLSLMFIGACGGSTGGSIKVIRVYVLLKYIGLRIRQILYPHAIFVLKMGKVPISDDILQGITAFVFSYFLIFAVCSIAMTAIGFDMISAVSSVAATLGNVGPGFGLVAANYASVPTIGKIILSFCMWIGRLELFTVLVLLTPAFWKG
ncbi:MAG TPA: TrkH family potassium uptake protein [Candidatus Bathyarchaeia archaeon]|nr:TrkH family potassium uptake protein [Candidatus Bathyarchaeia archaeon]